MNNPQKASVSLTGAHDNAADAATIGIVTPSYGLEKVSYLLSPPGFRFQTVRRLPVHRLVSGDLSRHSSFWSESALMLPNRAKLIHTFNTLPLNGKPYIVSFESELPRLLGKISARAMRTSLDALAHPRCRGIVALSERAAANARITMAEEGRPELARRIGVFRGAVSGAEAPRSRAAGDHGGPLRLLFVGKLLFHKGFGPVVEACERLHAQGVDFTLTVVGHLSGESYVYEGLFDPAKLDHSRTLAQPWLRYHKALPNSEVRKLMRDSDLLLFPSFDESLGWVVVEAGIEGLPSLTTNVFALPELVQDCVSGRIASLPLNRFGRWTGLSGSIAERRELYDSGCAIIRNAVEEAVTHASRNRSILAQWGSVAREHLHALYGVDEQSRALATLYRDALA